MEATDEYYESVDLHIRWSDRQDLILRVSPDETIYTIKEKVILFAIRFKQCKRESTQARRRIDTAIL